MSFLDLHILPKINEIKIKIKVIQNGINPDD